MSVTFLGDIALPHPMIPSVTFDDGLVIANLEGALSGRDQLSERVVYNDLSSIDFLKQSGINAVTLANNHIFDLGTDVSMTESLLREQGILFFGAGQNVEAASRPLVGIVDGVEVIVFSAGWHVIGCRSAGVNRSGVMPLKPRLLFSKLEQARQEHPNAKIIFYVHWNYELELYPQPAHRQLAFDLIAAGAWAVIGAHSHCVQGVERVGQGFVAHGLGNWAFPQSQFFNGKLSFPDFSMRQFSCHVDVSGTEHKMGWYRYDGNTKLEKIRESAVEDTELHELTPFRGLSHNEYKRWFRNYRRKKKLLPIYMDYRHHVANKLKDSFVGIRGFAINKMVEFGLKGGPK